MCDPYDLGWGVYYMIIGMVLLSFSVCFSTVVSSKVRLLASPASLTAAHAAQVGQGGGAVGRARTRPGLDAQQQESARPGHSACPDLLSGMAVLVLRLIGSQPQLRLRPRPQQPSQLLSR